FSLAETKRTVSWLEKQFTMKASRNYDSSNAFDYPTAVAVAAFVVKSIEDKSNGDQIKTNIGANKSLSKIKSKADDTIGRPEKSTAVNTSKSSSKVLDKNVVIRTSTVNQEPVNSISSFKQSATSSETRKMYTADKKFPSRQSTSKKEMTKGPITTNPGVGNSKADIWEKEEMNKIKEWHEKLNKVIIDRETKKKKKAKRHLEQIEAQLDRRRAKIRQSFYSDIGRIENIAGGAKTQAEKNQEKEELKVKAKANKIRSTGKIPGTCLCF
ncbi:putative pentatricopeptide repeat-containing protein-like, partial [Capsicum annuum]